MALLKWEYYSTLYDQVPQSEFERQATLAEIELKRVIGLIKWANLVMLDEDIKNEIYYEQLLNCLCNIINYNAAGAGRYAGTGLSSVSNDGYSENYVVQKVSDAQAELAKNIRGWLSGTGLVGAY